MPHLVQPVLRRRGEGLAALGADVRLLAGVDADVLLQVGNGIIWRRAPTGMHIGCDFW